MAGSLGNTYENNVLDALLGQGFTKPGTVYVALCTDAPSDSALGTEPVGDNYSRVAVTNNATNWPNAASGSKSNGTAIIFATASGDGWGTVTHFMVMDVASGGSVTNMLGWADLTNSRTVGSGETPQFAIGTLVLTGN